jgi:hypothetical protein
MNLTPSEYVGAYKKWSVWFESFQFP